MVDGAISVNGVWLLGHSRLIVSTFGEEPLMFRARDALEPGCLDRREKVGEALPEEGEMGSLLSMGSLDCLRRGR